MWSSYIARGGYNVFMRRGPVDQNDDFITTYEIIMTNIVTYYKVVMEIT